MLCTGERAAAAAAAAAASSEAAASASASSALVTLAAACASACASATFILRRESCGTFRATTSGSPARPAERRRGARRVPSARGKDPAHP